MATVLEEAASLVYGDRQASYGHPAQDFARTGQMWAAILGLPEPVPADKVALCMIAVKISRLVNQPKRDSVVDIAGYAATIELVHEAQGNG